MTCFSPQEPKPDTVVAMTATLDAAGQGVLVVSYVSEKWLRTYSIPDFAPLGTIPIVS